MSRDSKTRKKARKERNKAYHESLLHLGGEPRKRWQGSIDLRFGSHPDATFRAQFSGVRIDVDLDDPNHLDGVREVTESILAPDTGERN